MRVLLSAVLAACVLAGSAEGATRTAASCSRSDVGSAVNAAADGDIVVIPAGTCTWTSNLTISSKAITLQGAGIDRTVIVDAVSKGDYPNVPQILTWQTKAGRLTRITGMTFQGGTILDEYNKGMLWIEGNCHQMRIDHVRVVTTQTSGIHFHGNVLGVIDHSVFDLNDWGFGIFVHHENWNDAGDYGDVSWASPAPLGTDQALFIEDNVFQTNLSGIAVDGWSGSRMVFRRNTLRNAAIANHGTDTPGRWRSQRTFEVYGNTILFDTFNWASMFGTRGGTGVVYNNVGTTSGAGQTNTIFDMTVYRSADPGRISEFGPWGVCNGSNPWDGNQDSSGWPCLDQVGRGQGSLISSLSDGYTPTPVGWPKQALDPIYAWGNTLNGSVSAPIIEAPAVTQIGRDVLTSPKPGYVPYVYPHPLVSGTPQQTSTPPPAPTNLRITSP